MDVVERFVDAGAVFWASSSVSVILLVKGHLISILLKSKGQILHKYTWRRVFIFTLLSNKANTVLHIEEVVDSYITFQKSIYGPLLYLEEV